jgi:putative ABC transport system permease protein
MVSLGHHRVSLMVSSFRRTVVTWLSETLQGDIYISAPSLTATTSSTPVEGSALRIMRQRPEIERLDVLRSVDVDSPQGPVHIAATDNLSVGLERIYYALDVPREQIWPRLLEGAVLVSEPFANRLGLPRHAAVVTLDTPNGPQQFPCWASIMITLLRRARC